MKTVKVISFMFIVFLLCSLSQAYAIGVGSADLAINPYLKGGSISWDELDGIGGHKFVVGGGLDTNLYYNRVKGRMNLEGWIVGEGMDDDRGIIPRYGFSISADIGYKVATIDNFTLYPYTGIGFERWDRDHLQQEQWTSLRFFDWTIGLSVEHPVAYGRLEMSFPFSQETNKDSSIKPKPGFYSEAGMNIKQFLIGLFFSFSGFEDPDAKMTQSGILFGYRFR
jgi:hypothetical protein